MSGKRVFQIIVGFAALIVALLAVQPIVKASDAASANQQALHQQQLSERYGQVAEPIISQQMLRLQQFGERYGQVAQPVITEHMLRLQQFGERYGAP